MIDYKESIAEKGLAATWQHILSNEFPSAAFPENKLAGLYEEGLAIENKIEKKAMGKYYTPDDVATVMAQYLLRFSAHNICDLCCGTGNLILAVLEQMSPEERRNHEYYIYDIDETALLICQALVREKYGVAVHMWCGDCLNPNFHLPADSVIISNPPYGKKDGKEMYAAFIEKIVDERLPAVVITPHSFMGGSSFQPLRNKMDEIGGTIFSFDNVPGNIFKGKKFGIFNSNTANSTRAAITILNPQESGYLVSPFIRFKTADRAAILNVEYLDSLLPSVRQQGFYYRYFKEDEKWVQEWLQSEMRFADLLSKEETEWRLDFSTSCRYFTVAAKRELQRDGKFVLYFKGEQEYYWGYAILNSDLCYYWHRMCNGGITYPLSLLKEMPIPASKECRSLCEEIMREEPSFLAYKTNAGKVQETVKLPACLRLRLTELVGGREYKM